MSSVSAPAEPILIVEDDEGLGLLLQRALRRCGHQAQLARSGGEARAWLANHRPKLMLLDYALGDTNAVAFLDSLPNPAAIPPFIVTTGNGNEQVAVTLMQRGAQDYLVKDATLLDLVPTVVQRALERLDQGRRLKQAEVQLRHQDKLVGLGQLAAGVAHEINNPVGFLHSNLGTLGEYLGFLTPLLAAYGELADAVQGGRPTRDALARIQELRAKEDLDFVLEDARTLAAESLEGTRRVGEIVRNLKSFARLDEAPLQEADVNAGLESSLRLLAPELKHKATVHKQLAPLPALRCYPGQLNQVFVNLLINACQAIPERGEIRVTSAQEGDEVVIRVSDTGCGIPPEVLPRIFDPFFTTKPVGQGTGLGLSISDGIVRRHGGRIDVASEPGKGSTFTLRLPLAGVPAEGRG